MWNLATFGKKIKHFFSDVQKWKKHLPLKLNINWPENKELWYFTLLPSIQTKKLKGFILNGHTLNNYLSKLFFQSTFSEVYPQTDSIWKYCELWLCEWFTPCASAITQTIFFQNKYFYFIFKAIILPFC